MEFAMKFLITNGQNYDNVLLSQSGEHVRLAIHSMNATLCTKLSPNQVRDLITNLRQVLATLESNAQAE